MEKKIGKKQKSMIYWVFNFEADLKYTSCSTLGD